jgi:hypothetical protein
LSTATAGLMRTATMLWSFFHAWMVNVIKTSPSADYSIPQIRQAAW